MVDPEFENNPRVQKMLREFVDKPIKGTNTSLEARIARVANRKFSTAIVRDGLCVDLGPKISLAPNEPLPDGIEEKDIVVVPGTNERLIPARLLRPNGRAFAGRR